VHTSEPDTAPKARIPADVDTPDKIVYGLTARQLAILAIAGVAVCGLVKTVGPLLPRPVLIAALTPVVGATVVLALGRRDGLSMDRWLLSAIRHTRDPKRLAPAPPSPPEPLPAWAPAAAAPVAAASPLRLPSRAITESGVIDTGNRAVALVAATTVNIGLRTGEEQNALISAYGRWLNSLAGPVQIVISAQRVDLSSHAQRIAERAETIGNPALAEAAHDYAAFLDDLAARRDPLWRTVTVAVTATGERGRDTEVLRRADHAASALSALGAQTAVLDGARATAVLTCAVDPYTPADISWPRARPDAVITGPGARS
jgi:PrgI family protein